MYVKESICEDQSISQQWEFNDDLAWVQISTFKTYRIRADQSREVMDNN